MVDQDTKRHKGVQDNGYLTFGAGRPGVNEMGRRGRALNSLGKEIKFGFVHI